MKRKLVSILLTAAMVFSLAGCGSSAETEVSEPVVSEVESVEETENIDAETELETVEPVEETTEQTSETVEKLDGFQYQFSFDVDGTQKLIGFNIPDGYELESTTNDYYKFVNVKNDYFTMSPFVVEGFGEEAINAYENYLSTGEWKGLFEFTVEELLSERTVEVPGGIATIIVGVVDDLFKNQNVFIDFGGSIVHLSMYLNEDFMIMDGEAVSGSEEEFIVDDVLAQLFVESDNIEYLYPISESTVEIVEGTYEYDLSYYDVDTKKTVAYCGFNLPEGDFVQSEEDLELAELHSQYGNTYYTFMDSNKNTLSVAETMGSGSPYETVCVYRHFLRTGEMEEGVENTFFGEGGWMDMHTGTLVDMQLGETVETTYGSVNIVKGLWQYDILTEVTETIMLKVNDREVFVTFHNKNAEPGVTLDGYEGQLAGMLAEMF